MKLILIFMNTMKKKYKLIKISINILFRIDIYCSEYFSAVEIDEKGHTDREILFEEKRQKALEEKLGYGHGLWFRLWLWFRSRLW